MKYGDILLEDYTGKYWWSKRILSIQDYFDEGKYNHAMIYIGNGEAIEQNIGGFNVRDVSSLDLTIKRYNKRINEEQMGYVIEEYIGNTDLKYGYFDLFKESLAVVLWKLFGVKFKSLPDLDSDFCSEMIWKLYDGIGIRLTRFKPTPNDLDRCNKLKTIN